MPFHTGLPPQPLPLISLRVVVDDRSPLEFFLAEGGRWDKDGMQVEFLGLQLPTDLEV